MSSTSGNLLLRIDGSAVKVPLTVSGPTSALDWDGRLDGRHVTYDSTGQGSVPGYSMVEGGTQNPSYLTSPRVQIKPGPGLGKAAALFTVYDQDPLSVKPAGASSNPSASLNSPWLIKPGRDWWIGWRSMLPDGSTGEVPFPLIEPGPGHFFQTLEIIGPTNGKYTGSPPWAVSVLDVGAKGQNRWIVPSNIVRSSGTPLYLAGPPVIPQHWHTFIAHVGMSATASTDGGKTGGFLELMIDGTWQTFANDASWVTANQGRTLCIATVNNLIVNSTGNFVVFDAYRMMGQYPLVQSWVAPVGVAPDLATLQAAM